MRDINNHTYDDNVFNENKPTIYDGLYSQEFLEMISGLFTEVMNETKDEYGWRVTALDTLIGGFDSSKRFFALYGIKIGLISNIAYAPIEIEVMFPNKYYILKEGVANSILQGTANKDIKKSIKTSWLHFWHSTNAYELYKLSGGRTLHKEINI